MLVFVVADDMVREITPSFKELLKRGVALSGYDGDFGWQCESEAVEDPVDTDVLVALGTKTGLGTLPSPKKLLTSATAITQVSLTVQHALRGASLGDDSGPYVVAESFERALEWLTNQPDTAVAIDIETGGDINKDKWASGRVLCVGLYAGGGEKLIITDDLLYSAGVDEFFQTLSTRYSLVAHNSSFDIPYLRGALGISPFYNQHDTMIALHTLYNQSDELGLKAAAGLYLGAPKWDEAMGAKKNLENVEQGLLYEYNGKDVYWTHALHTLFQQLLSREPQKLEYYRYRMKVCHMLQDIQVSGTPCDTEILEKDLATQEAELAEKLSHLRKVWGFPDLNPQSPKQMYSAMAAREIDTGKYNISNPGKPTTSQPILQHMLLMLGEDDPARPLLEALMDYKLSAKARRYTKQFLEAVVDGVVHSTYRQTTSTGRLAALKPPLQQLPRDGVVKRALVSEPGHVIVACDYSQAELRTVAEISDDEGMIAAFAPGAPDFFDALISAIYPEKYPTIGDVDAFHRADPAGYKDARAKIKGIVYGLNYGRGARTISFSLKITPDEAQDIIDRYLAAYPSLAQWRQRTVDAATGRVGNGLRNIFGLDYRVEYYTNQRAASVANSGLAFLPQSTANDICLKAALKLHERFSNEGDMGSTGARIVGLVHDAIYVHVKEEHAKLIGELMAFEMTRSAKEVFKRVPFVAEAEFGRSWRGE